jgi:hypothetical protein
VFMQDFSVESMTSEISSLSTSWQDLEARYKSSNEVNMTPRSPRTKPEKMKNFEDPFKKLTNLARRGASFNPKRNWRQGPTCRWGKTLEDLGTETGQRRSWVAPKWAQAAGPGWLAQPISRPSRPPPFDLATIQAIYIPEARHHTSTHSPSAADEQRREGHHLEEERVEPVD